MGLSTRGATRFDAGRLRPRIDRALGRGGVSFPGSVPDDVGTDTRLTPNLLVEDVAETVARYEAVLGAEQLARMPPEGDDPEWGQVEFGDV
ncbi:MAG: hypothetical protein V5A43_11740 [Haloarculaceae archaeon]